MEKFVKDVIDALNDIVKLGKGKVEIAHYLSRINEGRIENLAFVDVNKFFYGKTVETKTVTYTSFKKVESEVKTKTEESVQYSINVLESNGEEWTHCFCISENSKLRVNVYEGYVDFIDTRGSKTEEGTCVMRVIAVANSDKKRKLSLDWILKRLSTCETLEPYDISELYNVTPEKIKEFNLSSEICFREHTDKDGNTSNVIFLSKNMLSLLPRDAEVYHVVHDKKMTRKDIKDIPYLSHEYRYYIKLNDSVENKK